MKFNHDYNLRESLRAILHVPRRAPLRCSALQGDGHCALSRLDLHDDEHTLYLVQPRFIGL